MTCSRFLPFLALLSGVSVHAAVQPDPLFSDHTVLQQGMTVPVWGQADPGESVKVEIAGRSGSTVSDADGRWRVDLPSLPVGGPYELTFTGDDGTLTVRDVLVGEVWLCSGQSNMARGVVPPPHVEPRYDLWEEAATEANFPQIREFRVRGEPADSPHPANAGDWKVCTPENVRDFSAVGYFFARDLSRARDDVPVGIITAAVGATGIANWTGVEALESEPELKSHMDYTARRLARYPQQVKAYEAERKAYEEAKARGEELPKEPREPKNPFTNPYRMAANYNGKIAPLMPYAIRGAVWYQGENDRNRPGLYRYFLRTLIRSWRENWGQGDFPFIVIQLPDHKQTPPEFRIAQREGADDEPNTAVVITHDVGDAEDIHPPNKEPVGRRAALAARVLAYGEPVLGLSPKPEDFRVDGRQVRVQLAHADGLEARGGPALGVEIAGADRVFVPADVTVQGHSLLVSADAVAEPKFIRHAWANVPRVNLYNQAELPLIPFLEPLD